MSDLFRQTAIDRLSGPERLDTLVRITRPRAWIALGAVFVVLAGAVFWGVYGHAPDTIEGAGMIMRRGGLFEIDAQGAGVIRELLVKPGDHVKAGDVVARIAQPELERTILQTEALIAEMTRHGAQRGRFIGRGTDLEKAGLRSRLKQIEESTAALRAQQGYLAHRRDAQSQALASGLIARDAYEDTIQQLARVREGLGALETERRQIAARHVQLDNDAGERLFSVEQGLRAQQRQLEILRHRHAATAEVESPHSGLLVEQRADPGDVIDAGRTVFTVELSDQPLDSVIFVPLEGKRLTPGMKVQLSPAGVPWEEYGYMLGTVQSVSPGPASSASMNALLRNDALVQQFSAGGGAYLVVVDLLEDARSPSGFKWTTRLGPSMPIGSGTLLRARFIVGEQRPIHLVVPALRRWLGV